MRGGLSGLPQAGRRQLLERLFNGRPQARKRGLGRSAALPILAGLDGYCAGLRGGLHPLNDFRNRSKFKEPKKPSCAISSRTCSYEFRSEIGPLPKFLLLSPL